jgi:hypothetical protein
LNGPQRGRKNRDDSWRWKNVFHMEFSQRCTGC